MKTTLTIDQSAELIKRGVSSDKASAAVIYLDYAGEEVEPHKVFKREGDGILLTRLRNESVIGVEAKIVFKDSGSNYSTSIFTLNDLLSLLPKEIKRDSLDRPYVLHIIREEDRTIAAYRRDWDSITGADKRTSEFIDSLYELLLWAIDHNHVKLD